MNNGLQTLFTGRQMIHLETVDSTNSFINKLLLHDRLPEGAAILSHEQTAGRGQAGEQWISEQGKNILVSIIYYPSFISIQRVFMLSKAFSLGVYDCIREILREDVKIKWPNDIYFRNKKLGGILIENSIRNSVLNHTLLGIGLNLNQEVFPATLPNPVSLKMILGKELDLHEFFNGLCNSLEHRYLQLKAGHTEDINEDYLNALYRFGEFHDYQNNAEKFKGKITGIGDDGKIMMIRENGIIEKYDFKEVRFVI